MNSFGNKTYQRIRLKETEELLSKIEEAVFKTDKPPFQHIPTSGTFEGSWSFGYIKGSRFIECEIGSFTL